MGAPVIGITSWIRPIATQLGEGRPTHTLGIEYADTIALAGGLPVLLPPSGDPGAILDRIDGLVLSGGEDVDPSRYGARPEPGKAYSADRDRFEIELVRLARARRMPTLAICRGLQVTNVAFGGSLIVDLPVTPAHARVVDGAEQLDGRHAVRFTAGSRLERVYGAGERVVNTIHHQAVDRLGDGLIASAFASDGVIEAIEPSDDWPLLAVQWHPEKMTRPDERTEEQALFDDYLAQVRLSLAEQRA